RSLGLLLALVATLVAAAAAGLALGAVTVPLGDIAAALQGRGSQAAVAIVRDVRLPRVLLTMLVGAGLGMSGAALQATMRNALAEPYLLGVSGGAAVGAVVSVALGATSSGAISLAAFIGALGAVTLVLAVARTARTSSSGADPRVLLMSGVVVGAFANAAIMILLANAPGGLVRNALWWMMGSASAADWSAVRWMAGSLLVAGAALLHLARQVDLLALGHDAAASLGVDPDRATQRVFVVASLLAAATVATAGLVGFVGLIVPHIARSATGGRHRTIFVLSSVAGGALLILADLVARTALAPAELPLGAVTAILGVPFFLVVLRRSL
ncbi:MAG: iron ABC transporter permease, partial [Planctomycetota bacterium]